MVFDICIWRPVKLTWVSLMHIYICFIHKRPVHKNIERFSHSGKETFKRFLFELWISAHNVLDN